MIKVNLERPMNAVEIEEAVSALAAEPFDPGEFPFAFLEAFGNKQTTIKRLRAGNTNPSDVGGGLQRSNIHIKVAPEGAAAAALAALKASPETARAKCEVRPGGRTGESSPPRMWRAATSSSATIPTSTSNSGFFLPLAGITTVKQIRESAFDLVPTHSAKRTNRPAGPSRTQSSDPLGGSLHFGVRIQSAKRVRILRPEGRGRLS